MYGLRYSPMSVMGYSFYSGMGFPRVGKINYFNNNYQWGFNTGFGTNYAYYNGRVGYAS